MGRGVHSLSTAAGRVQTVTRHYRRPPGDEVARVTTPEVGWP